MWVPVAIAVLFFLAKLVEMKWVEKEWKPMKFVIRDTLIVFVVSAIVVYAYTHLQGNLSEFMSVVTDTKSPGGMTGGAPEIFTDAPGF